MPPRGGNRLRRRLGGFALGVKHSFAVLRQALLGNQRILTMVVEMVRNESNLGEWSRLAFAMPA